MKKIILHMDNEEDILFSVKTVLEKQGYEVVSASTGREAIRVLSTGHFDLVILDIMMPDLSGWDVFSRLMKIDADQKVVFLSVLEVSPERKKQLEEHGIADYILKPFDRDDFIKRIKIAIGD